MKIWTKILVAVLTLAMIFSIVACNGDKPEESTPAPQESSSESSTSKNPPIVNPGDTDPGDIEDDKPDSQPDATPINDALAGFVSGDLLDGKLVAVNGYAGAELWTGTTLDGYAIMTTNPGMDETRAAIELNVAVTELSVLKFKAKVDTDLGDQFSVIVDGKQNAAVGKRDAGEHELAIMLDEGEHSIVLLYQKDESGFDGTDTVYVSKATLESISAVIDGEKDAFYDDATVMPIRNPYSSNPEGWAGGGTAYIKNDSVGLYIYVEVMDGHLVYNSDDSVDNEDKVQIYLDYARSFEDENLAEESYRNTATAGSMKLGWVNVNPGGTFGSGYGFKEVAGIKGASVDTDNGYAIEVFIPLANSLIVDNTIGLGIQISDDNGDSDKETNASFYSRPQAEGASGWWNHYETLPEFILQ